MREYLVRLAQAHESFRKVELKALADLAQAPLEFVQYEEDVCIFYLEFCSSTPTANSRSFSKVIPPLSVLQ